MGETLADEPPKKPEAAPPAAAATAARRAQEITDVVLENHIDPPARQQMVLSGIKALSRAAGLPVPPGLGRRVSAMTTPEQLAALLEEALAGKRGHVAASSSRKPCSRACSRPSPGAPT